MDADEGNKRSICANECKLASFIKMVKAKGAFIYIQTLMGGVGITGCDAVLNQAHHFFLWGFVIHSILYRYQLQNTGKLLLSVIII